MAENKRKGGARGSKGKAVDATRQRTLLQHFQKKSAAVLPAEPQTGNAAQTPAVSEQESQASEESTPLGPSNAELVVVVKSKDPKGATTDSPTTTSPPMSLPTSQNSPGSQDISIPSKATTNLRSTSNTADNNEDDSIHSPHSMKAAQSNTRLGTPISIADTPPPSSSCVASPDVIVVEEGGSRDDPIVIEQSPVQPREDIRPAKPVFPIFAPRTRSAREPTPTPSAPQAKVKPVFPIFAAARKTAGTPAPPSPTRRAKGSDAPLPDTEQQHQRGTQTSFRAPRPHFGNRDKGKTKATAEDGQNSLPTLSSQKEDSSHLSSSSYCAAYGPSFSSELISTLLDTVPRHHRENYPAISRILDYLRHNELHSSSQLWTERWRPKRAGEVLGNEANALYLRSWLEALALQNTQADPEIIAGLPENPQGKKRKSRSKAKRNKEGRNAKKPKIQRTVERPKGRRRRRIDSDLEDDWIVDTGDERESDMDVLPGSEDDLTFCRQVYSRLHPTSDSVEPVDATAEPPQPVPEEEGPRIPPSQPHFRNRLTNTILLTGPPGCGKTAAVYACAEELGWEVFEVYPGIGKRSNTNLDSLVGDVGKNHTLRKGVFRKPAGLFTKYNEARPQTERNSVDPDEASSRDQDNLPPSHSQDSGFTSPSKGIDARVDAFAATIPQEDKIRQSLVLLEEVDVLYKEDQSFWPAVISLIKDCRRPVVMTCNDLSLVPLQDLPLQEILTFSPAPAAVTASYLQCLSLAEGFCIDHRFLTDLCKTLQTWDVDVLTDTIGWTRHQDLQAGSDLRKTINQLQFLCSVKAAFWLKNIENPELLGSDPPTAISTEYSGSTSGAATDGSSDARAQLELLRGLAHHTETLSFLDGALSRKAWQMPQVLLEQESQPSVSDETGHRMLFSGPTVHALDATALYHWDEDIRQEVRQWLWESIARSPSLPRGHDSFRTRGRGIPEMHVPSRTHVSHVVAVLRSILPSTFAIPSASPEPALFLDYLPWVRHMVAADEEEERRETQIAKPGRRTRNSQKYEQYISLSDEQRSTLRSLGLQAEV